MAGPATEKKTLKDPLRVSRLLYILSVGFGSYDGVTPGRIICSTRKTWRTHDLPFCYQILRPISFLLCWSVTVKQARGRFTVSVVVLMLVRCPRGCLELKVFTCLGVYVFMLCVSRGWCIVSKVWRVRPCELAGLVGKACVSMRLEKNTR